METLSNSPTENSNAEIVGIIKNYNKAISLINDVSDERHIEFAKDIFKNVQQSSYSYLQPLLKCKVGEPDSAHNALLNLIQQDKNFEDLFKVELLCKRNCEKCGTSEVLKREKTIITLSKVQNFTPGNPEALYQCSVCLSVDQKLCIIYKTLPPCVIFHFENGAGIKEEGLFDFEINDRKYFLTGLIVFKNSNPFNHFISYVRDIHKNLWLECNDLEENFVKFSSENPNINLEDIYIVIYEALDDKGTLHNSLNVIDEEKMVSNFELIDICSESDGDTSEDEKLSSENVCSENKSSWEDILTNFPSVKLVSVSSEDVVNFVDVEKQDKANKTTETKKIDAGNQNLMGIFEDSETIDSVVHADHEKQNQHANDHKFHDDCFCKKSTLDPFINSSVDTMLSDAFQCLSLDTSSSK
ncbi:SUMO-specific isopeptidase USPL1 [Caerostris darwini]|uniref:SUMO-specific isopeptidase USPL1 n=1 Tax=Caerostris darwini TaxID=1538125 RepID=A0AAV4SXX6_9ARAC|nr:SUMO-specific isopeptidase USPL1 [Caerostris darwini]